MDALSDTSLIKFNPDTLDAVRKLYDLDKAKVSQSVDILEEWVKKQSHFRSKEYSREYFERVLITCKGSVEKAKSQIDKLCTLKTLVPKYFIYRDLKDKLASLTDVVCCVPMPKMTQDHQRIYLVKFFGAITPAYFFDCYRLNVMISEYLKKHDYQRGFIIIQDLTEANLSEVLKSINLIEMQQFFTIIIDGYSARMSGIHLVSQSKLVDIFARIIKSVLSEKLANRIHSHQHMDELYKHVDKQLLPVELGGSQKPLRELQDQWLEVMCSEEYQKYLEKTVEARTDESVRMVDKFNEQYMGMPGSFRTLTVD